MKKAKNEGNRIFSQNLQYLMRQRDMSQADLCRLTGFSHTIVSAWYNGEKMPRNDKIDRLCEIFNCDRSALLVDDPMSLYLQERNRRLMEYMGKISELSLADQELVLRLVDSLVKKGGGGNDN